MKHLIMCKCGKTMLQCKTLSESIEWLIQTRIKETTKEIFAVFDEYACIKNDAWYKKLKEKHRG